MKTAISGGWRITNTKVKKDIKKEIKTILNNGNSIITGGALGVDFIATNEVLKYDPQAQKINIILPTSLKNYASHYKKRAQEKAITLKQAEQLINQLTKITKLNPNAIKTLNNHRVNQKTYYQRNLKIIEQADNLIAFQINNSKGTQDTIDKAKEKNIPIKVFKYKIHIE
jgi:uncharacterized phage-like protein YoqJ